MFLADDFAYVWNELAGCHEVSHVVHLQTIVTSRDDGFALALDGYDVIGVFRTADVAHRAVEYRTRLTQLDTKHDKRSTVNVPTLAHPRHLESVVYVCGCEHLWIDYRADSESGKELFEVGFDIFRVVYLSHRLSCAKSFGKNARCHVLTFIGSYSNKQIGTLRSCLLKRLDTGRRSLHCEYVYIRTNTRESLLVVIHDYYIVMIAREQTCKMSTDGVCASYNYLHIGLLGVDILGCWSGYV